MAVPYTFANATTAIPLSQLDNNFATAITIGNTAVQLGNTITTANNMTLANVTISSVSTAITAAQGGTGLTTLTANSVIIGNGTGSVTFVAPGTNGNVLASNGTAWVSTAAAASGFPITLGNTSVAASSTTTAVGNLTLNLPTVTNYVETLYSATGNTSVSLTNGTIQKITTSGSTTITLPSSVSGKSFTIIVSYAAADALSWAGGSTLKWASGTTPTATSVTGKIDIFNFYQDGTNTYGSIFGQNY
jgi:hypothetical protein